jgi:hypothetical protein
MKLITEMTEEISFITESTENGKKKFAIEGVFMQSDTVNRNGRVYPKHILEGEVDRYNKKYVMEKRALGELNHPSGPTVNLDKVSHLITDLRMEGKDVKGKAKLLETPCGLIAQSLIESGVKLGVSSRGMGSLKENRGYKEVQKDFMLSAVDIVADPSAPNAFVNGIMEGVEWVWDNGVLKQEVIENYKSTIKKTPSRLMEKTAISLFEDFMNKISSSRNSNSYK